jgi:hypothetical protein
MIQLETRCNGYLTLKGFSLLQKRPVLFILMRYCNSLYICVIFMSRRPGVKKDKAERFQWSGKPEHTGIDATILFLARPLRTMERVTTFMIKYSQPLWPDSTCLFIFSINNYNRVSLLQMVIDGTELEDNHTNSVKVNACLV